MPKRTRSGDTDPKYLRKVEVHPDISLELSRLPSVRKLIEENNAQTKPRFRLKVSDFCNEAILTLAKGENGPSDVFVFLNEMEENLKYTPRVSSITKILYLWNSTPSRVADAVKLIRRTLDSASGGGGASSTDESFVTVSLRVITNCETPDEGLITRVLSSLPKENYKRRLFHPLFEFGREHHNVEFAFSMLKIAVEANVELWDVDYHILLQTVVERSEVQGKVKSAIELLNMMALHHPVMGRLNAEMIQTIVGGTVVRISEDGHCGGCAQRLRSFDLSQEERAVLVRDVVEKLVTPRVICQSHYEPLVEVTEEEQTARWGIFNTFVTSMEHNDYDTLIDGANLGYYGLNSWYSEAKVELLKRKGVDPATVPLKERNNVPFPVDVPPKFETIEHARKSAATRGRKPLIILHERHIREAIGTNQTILEQWKELNCVLASPHFLNDDYCWLYGSLKKPGTWIITNDQMRDHHFLLLSQQMFIRWRQRHRITYKALHDRVSGTTTIALKFPKPFSVWVQTAADNVETHWHVPFVSGIDILNQATNKTEFTPSDFGLHKDGDDECSSWLCTVKNP